MAVAVSEALASYSFRPLNLEQPEICLAAMITRLDA